MNMIKKTVCFTGHRTYKPNEAEEKRLYAAIEELILQGYCIFAAGGARGFDQEACEAVLKLKEKYPQIKLKLILPFKNQFEHEGDWLDTSIELYKKHIESADETEILYDSYKRGCYYQRDRALVDCSLVCVAYCRRKNGGAAYTLRYARENNKKIINIAET